MWSLLKVREVKYRWKPGSRRVCFSSPGAFKTYTKPMGREDTGNSHPIINE
jgi:hypothetical protein